MNVKRLSFLVATHSKCRSPIKKEKDFTAPPVTETIERVAIDTTTNNNVINSNGTKPDLQKSTQTDFKIEKFLSKGTYINDVKQKSLSSDPSPLSIVKLVNPYNPQS